MGKTDLELASTKKKNRRKGKVKQAATTTQL